MERNLDPRLPAKSYDRVSSKSNKTSVVRTKTYPLISPDHNGSHSSSSHSRSNSSKDGSIYSYSDRDLMGDLVNVSSDTYISCAVGKKRSSARYYLDTVNEVVSFVKSLADACPCELDSEDQSVLSVGSGSGPHVSPCSADSLPNGIPRHDLWITVKPFFWYVTGTSTSNATPTCKIQSTLQSLSLLTWRYVSFRPGCFLKEVHAVANGMCLEFIKDEVSNAWGVELSA